MAEEDGAGQGTGDGSQGDQEGKGSEEEPFDRDRAMKTIEAQRASEKAAKDEASEARAELKRFQDEIATERKQREEADNEKLTAEEKREKRLADLEKKLSEGDARLAKQALRASAAEAGAIYPGDIPALIEPSSVKFDRDGDPKNVDELVADLKKRRPALFGTPKPGSGDGGARGGTEGGKAPDMGDLLRAARR